MSKQTEVPTSVADQHHERSKRHRGPDTKEPNDEDLASSNNNDLFFKMLGVIFRNAKYLERVDLQALLNTSNAVASFLVESYPWKDRFLRGTDKTTPSGKYQAEKSLPSLGIPPPFGLASIKPRKVCQVLTFHHRLDLFLVKGGIIQIFQPMSLKPLSCTFHFVLVLMILAVRITAASTLTAPTLLPGAFFW